MWESSSAGAQHNSEKGTRGYRLDAMLATGSKKTDLVRDERSSSG